MLKRFDTFMEEALYNENFGFYTANGGHAGRRGDFITSPEIGPLFGVVIGNALDTWWEEAGKPDPFIFVDVGAGPGTLAVAIRAAKPRCSDALHYVLVERSELQRKIQLERLTIRGNGDSLFSSTQEVTNTQSVSENLTDKSDILRDDVGPFFYARETLPEVPFSGVIFANELLDNLPLRLFSLTEKGWGEVFVEEYQHHEYAYVFSHELDDEVTEWIQQQTDMLYTQGLSMIPVGAYLPRQQVLETMVRDLRKNLISGRIILIDYMRCTLEMVTNPLDFWLRTYASHGRGTSPVHQPGSQDITCDVSTDQLANVLEPTMVCSQNTFLETHGIQKLVTEAEIYIQEHRGSFDLDSIRIRSRVQEAKALCDTEGLGGFLIMEKLIA